MIPATCHQTAPVRTESLVPSLRCTRAKALSYYGGSVGARLDMGMDGTMSIVSNRQLKTENRPPKGREVAKIGEEVTECTLSQRGRVQLIGGE